jgi:soluble lytic murein transglycosylase
VRLRWIYAFVTVILLAALAGELLSLYWQDHQPKEKPCDPLIVQVARESGVDPFLIRALIWRESKFNPQTHGLADERGLMQVTPQVGQMWAKANKIANFQPDDLYDPATNIEAGTWYLNRAIRHWSQTDDPVTFALAEYNAGPSNALRWVDANNPQDHVAFMDKISYPSTRDYVEKILTQRNEYRLLLAKDPLYREFATTDRSMTQAP